MKKVIPLLLVLVFGVLNVFTSDRREDFVIVGRVVNSTGKPIENATVHYLSSPSAHIVLLAESNADGTFEIRTAFNGGTVWITSGIDRDSDVKFSPGVNLTKQVTKNFEGTKIPTITKGRKIDLGKVPVQIQYGKVKIQVAEKSRTTVFDSGDPIEFRVRDKSGDILSEGTLNKGVNRTDSTISVSLPFGAWKFELKNELIDWQPVTENPIQINQFPTIVNFSLAYEKIGNSLKIRKLFELSETQALNDLTKRGFTFTKKSFEERLEKGNLEAVILFLRAGMSPNTRFDRGAVPLIFSIEYPEINEILIYSGANVNVKTDKVIEPEEEEQEGRPFSEETPLLWAVYKRNLGSLRVLLSNGALVNETNTYGDSPLSVAVENGQTEIVRELLKFGANPHIKTGDGKPLIEIAIERNDAETLELLRQAGSKFYSAGKKL